MIRAVTVATLSALLLSGCGSDERKAGPAPSAGGEILGQSVSDAMLPLDRVRSQAPLAPRSAKPGEAKAESGAEPKPRASAADKPAEAPEPAEDPAE